MNFNDNDFINPHQTDIGALDELRLENFSMDQLQEFATMNKPMNNNNLQPNQNQNNFLMPTSSGSLYSSEYESPNPIENHNYSHNQNLDNQEINVNSLKSMQNNQYFTPILNSTGFHERNRSEISDLASPHMNSTAAFYDNGAPSPIHNQEHQRIDQFNVEESNFDTMLATNDMNKYLEMQELESYSNNSNVRKSSRNEYAKNLTKFDLNSLGIDIKSNNNPANAKELTEENVQNMSFSINESFINELLNDNGDPNINSENLLNGGNDFVDTGVNGNDRLLPAFEEKTNAFLNPNNFSQLRQPPKSNSAQNRKSFVNKLDDIDDGDTTIMNNTSIVEMNDDKQNDLAPDTENIMDELNSKFSGDLVSRDTFTPTHSRNSSVNKFEMPQLKVFQKSPKLSSPGRVGKFTNNNNSSGSSFRSIPLLNERLTFIDDTSTNNTMLSTDQLLESPSRRSYNSSYIQNSLPGSPTRDIYLTRTNDSDNSFIVKAKPIGSPINGSNAMFFDNAQFSGSFIAQTPPASPSKAMSGLSLSSPSRSNSSSPSKGFSLRPAPNGRKRVATAPRSKTGCWTCRIRHKKCDEGRPVCKNCAKINLKCDQFYDPKPSYMTNDEERKNKLAEIAYIWKNRSKKSSNTLSTNKTDFKGYKRQLNNTNRAYSQSPSPVKVTNFEDATFDKENMNTA